MSIKTNVQIEKSNLQKRCRARISSTHPSFLIAGIPNLMVVTREEPPYVMIRYVAVKIINPEPYLIRGGGDFFEYIFQINYSNDLFHFVVNL